ncbi:hypothetical protein E3E23_05380 [Thermococcus sp. CX2]|uniref:DUF257 family protein n=1 Tax=Thermococcus sp. CX2 TaxID=163006 RepID=UPI00143BB362|nr:DUF257 family protein [Thermococcus sp. CX2]NJE85256.1 hypothetical protein [Thermococcus sp. CX2]
MGGYGIDTIFSKLKAGETVLVEYSSVSSPELLLYMACRYYTKKGVPILIDDISDTLSEYVARLELTGLSTEAVLEFPIIKIGGTRQIGNIRGRVEVDKYSLDFKYYGKVYEGVISGDVVCNPVLGLYKLFLTLERKEAIRLIRNVSTFVGKKSRIALYFMNRDVMEEYVPELLSLLEEVSSTVLRWDVEEDKYWLRVVKSASSDILGSNASLRFRDVAGM